MAFYIVVHHPSDPRKPYQNVWDERMLLSWITTPKNVAARLAEAQARGDRIYVNRCAWGDFPAELYCSALVSEVNYFDKTTAIVNFTDAQRVGAPPLVTPHEGQNSYDAEPPRVAHLIS
jgi:hypothetical protein